ncbi:inositol 1,4,5-trisphosphate receptor-interacting protein-like [Seriola lalandi dorsalis]|uniref:inositol 1,4,5-trisphosphate receptor-interacting protein-like n=1 Tax=Seriola lalandi dorsalis TaxID=1841481 RepID=UPI000C6F8E36|nr:inositol 1,4,5-trisphosphate receptor-interacting protein-like [Seriola lalandi dorsalis]
MQDTLLRVFWVGLGLLMCPRDDPGVEEELGDINTVGMQKHDEKLLREEKKLDQEMAPVRQKITHNDDYDGHKLPEGGHFIASPESRNESGHELEGSLRLDARSKQREDIQTEPIRPQGQQQKPEEMEDFSSKEEASSLSEGHIKLSENETSEKVINDSGEDYLWYIWNTFSIISMIRFFNKYLRKNSQKKQGEAKTSFSGTCIAGEVPLPDSDTLQSFHSKCVQASSNKKWREDEFLEGFATQMVETMRTICDRNGGMVIGDCQMLDACDIIVPINPPEPYSFQYLLRNNHASDLQPDIPICGQIKVVENKKIQNGCPCQSYDADDDMVCLLHCENDKVKTKAADVCDGMLCLKNTPFLSKSQVTRWFQSTIKQAWALISYKYEFDLSIRNVDAPGALVVRFRSGKKVSFSMNPVVKLNTAAHFYITPCSPNNLDTFWTLSLTIYEDQLLEGLSKRLPLNSCHTQTLEIARFLHNRQTALSGISALKDFHFKTALMHLLLTKDPSQWKPNDVAWRLRDLLDFMERSLEKKLLHHVLIGNPLTKNIIQLPAEFTQAKPVNLFHPLVVHDCICRNALMHFQEMLRNTHMLIHDYVDKCQPFEKM